VEDVQRKDPFITSQGLLLPFRDYDQGQMSMTNESDNNNDKDERVNHNSSFTTLGVTLKHVLLVDGKILFI